MIATTAPYMLAAWQAIAQQLRRQIAEDATAKYYADVKARAEERRRRNPGAYVMPPGQHLMRPDLMRPDLPAHQCPECGHEFE